MNTTYELEEIVSFRKIIPGVDNTIFLTPKGIKVAIDPPHSLDPRDGGASITFDGRVVAGKINPDLLTQIQRFLKRNRETLRKYWNYEIDTSQLQKRLRKI
jgi:hypothetical protein